MNILHILPSVSTDKGGLEFSAAEIIASEYRQSDNKISVAIVNTAEGDTTNKLSRKLMDGPSIYRLTIEEDRSSQLQKIYEETKPDLVVFWLPEMTNSIINFLRNIKVPLIVRASTTYDLSAMHHERKEAYRQCYSLVKEKRGLVICNSDFNRDWNNKNFELPHENQKVIREGIDLKDDPSSPQLITRKSLGISENAYVVSNVTRVTSKTGANYRKDPFGFILMASYLSRTHPDTVFIMCGNGTQWDSALTQRLIDKANKITGGALTRNNFKALGQVENPSDIYKITDVAVSTAQSESFGRTTVEAMKYGIPSMVTDTGIMPEMNGEISHVIPVRKFSYANDEAYYGDTTNNLEWLASVENQFEQLRNRTTEKVTSDSTYLKKRVHEEYDMDAVAKRYIETYDDLVKTSKNQECAHSKKGFGLSGS